MAFSEKISSDRINLEISSKAKNTTFLEEESEFFCGREVGFDMCLKKKENYTATLN
jgi:hypothetical protein